MKSPEAKMLSPELRADDSVADSHRLLILPLPEKPRLRALTFGTHNL